MSETKVYSEYPVIVQHVGRIKDVMSSMDGGANPKQILAFQKWTNKFKFKEKKLAEDGKWGPKTSAAWNQFGGDYMSAGKAVAGIMDDFSKIGSGSGSDASEGGEKEKTGLFDKIGNLFNKAKGAKTKAEELKGKAEDLKNKAQNFGIGKTMSGDTGAFDDNSAPSEDAPKSKTKKIILWSALGLTAVIVIGYFVTKPKTGKA